jgi:hypothetical protein
MAQPHAIRNPNDLDENSLAGDHMIPHPPYAHLARFALPDNQNTAISHSPLDQECVSGHSGLSPFASRKIVSITTFTIVQRIVFFNKVVVNFFTFYCSVAFSPEGASDEGRKRGVRCFP